MSADPHYQATEEAHTGPIKNPKQLLLAVFFSFIAPIAIIVALVSFVSGSSIRSTASGERTVLPSPQRTLSVSTRPTATGFSASSMRKMNGFHSG